MKKYLDLRNIAIIILILLLGLCFLNPKGILPNRTLYVPQIDSVQYTVYDTLIEQVEVEVEVPVEVETIIEKTIEVQVLQPVDTQAIVKLFSENKQVKKDILELPGNIGTVTVFDTISNNRILGRSFTSKVKQKIIRDTSYMPEPVKKYYYFGVDAKFDAPNNVTLLGISGIMRAKDEKLYRVGIGVQNITGPDRVNGILVPYVGGGIYWKIGKKWNN